MKVNVDKINRETPVYGLHSRGLEDLSQVNITPDGPHNCALLLDLDDLVSEIVEKQPEKVCEILFRKRPDLALKVSSKILEGIISLEASPSSDLEDIEEQIEDSESEVGLPA